MKKEGIAAAALMAILLLAGCESSPSAVTQEPPKASPETIVPQATGQPSAEDKEKTVKEPAQGRQEGESQPPSPPASSTGEQEKPKSADDSDQAAKAETAQPPANGGSPGSAQPQPVDPGDEAVADQASAAAQQKEIIQRYEAQLEKLKAADLDKLNGLYDQVMAASQTGLSRTEVYNRFAQQAAAMEEEAQAQVNQVLQQLKDELTTLQLSTEGVSELRSAYYAEVSKAEKQLADKLKGSEGK
ncbi:hypothetical protein SK3146_03573 [Paenibacillus konkukensis]|uniref:Lipoprotein n=1 Tax=Paenibacillus konkukensis TaxID=2020716 RepID=A0ABY4RPC8_9BACL|nr:hypothetical protein [Paenibacillus konkukensis]UQZ84327.1 hypothetical protein SK3146_03573 [Paenibacillus konkukensis]